MLTSSLLSKTNQLILHQDFQMRYYKPLQFSLQFFLFKSRKEITVSYSFPEHLNNYFRLHVCLSFGTSHFHFSPISAVVSQNVTNERGLACVKSEKYVVWGTFRPLGSIRRGEAELQTLQY